MSCDRNIADRLSLEKSVDLSNQGGKTKGSGGNFVNRVEAHRDGYHEKQMIRNHSLENRVKRIMGMPAAHMGDMTAHDGSMSSDVQRSQENESHGTCSMNNDEGLRIVSL